MRLLIITPIFPPEIGGPATYTYELASRLKEKHDITIITFGDKLKPIEGVKIIGIPLFKSNVAGSLKRQIRLLIEVYRCASKTDFVYIQGPVVVGFIAVLVSRILNKPHAMKFVGDIPWEHARNSGVTNQNLDSYYAKPKVDSKSLLQKLLLKIITTVERVSFRLSATIITPSQYLKSFLETAHSVEGTKIVVISNAISVSQPKIKKSKNKIVLVNRLVPWKNTKKVIDAVAIAHQKKPWLLEVIGDGPEFNYLKNYCKKNKFSWVTMSGRQNKDDVHRAVSSANWFVLYSDYEGMPHVVIEAMMLKTAIIASDIKPNSEVLNGFGQLVPLDDTAQLAQTINTKPSATSKAQAFALKHYSWSKHISSLSKKIFNTHETNS